MLYCYNLVETIDANYARSVGAVAPDDVASMELMDAHAVFCTDRLQADIEELGGQLWGVWDGGMFGIGSDQSIIMTAWNNGTKPRGKLSRILDNQQHIRLVDHIDLIPTTRPADQTPPGQRSGFVVIRWMDMLVENMDAYVGLSEPSWSYFENGHDAEVLGLFKMVDDGSPIGKMLIVTWYANLTEWEETRVVGEVDGKMWAERAKMEIKQFGAAARYRC